MILIIVAFVYSMFGQAQTISVKPRNLSCSKNGTIIFYTNGVNTTSGKASDQINEVAALFDGNKELRETVDTEETNIQFLGIYNQHQTLMLDLLEVYSQKVDGVDGFRDKYEAYFKVLYNITKLPEPIGDELNQSLGDITINYLLNSHQHELDVNKHVELYEAALGDVCFYGDFIGLENKDIDNCRYKVIALSHSQGGLFVNEAYSAMSDYYTADKQSYFGSYQVASPASTYLAVNSSYRIFHKDRIINNSILTTPSVNITDPESIYRPILDLITEDPLDFVMNHGFLTTYLNDHEQNAAIRNSVLEGFGEVAEQLDSNCFEAPKVIFKNGGVEFHPGETINIDFGETLNLSVEQWTDPNDPHGDEYVLQSAKWSFPEYNYDYWVHLQNTSYVDRTEYNGLSVSYGAFQFMEDYWVDVEITDYKGDIHNQRINIHIRDEEPNFTASVSCTGPCAGSNYPLTVSVSYGENSYFVLDANYSGFDTGDIGSWGNPALLGGGNTGTDYDCIDPDYGHTNEMLRIFVVGYNGLSSEKFFSVPTTCSP